MAVYLFYIEYKRFIKYIYIPVKKRNRIWDISDKSVYICEI